MRNGIIILIAIVSFVNSVFADEFIVDKFYLDVKDLSGRTESKTDVNDEFCAIIKIRTDLDNLKFISNQLEDVVAKNNEYWLYISPGIKQFDIIRPGFITKSYEVPLTIESTNVYIMEMTNKEQTRLNVISLPISSTGANIFINGKMSDQKTPYMFKMNPGKYFVSIHHPDFDEMTKEVTLKEMETKELVFNLTKTNIIRMQQRKLYRGRKRIGFVGGILMVGTGFACNYLADQAYDKTYEAKTTSIANTEWDKYEQFKTMRNISYSVSALPFIYGTYNWIKEINLK